jgi:hypothetical protein
VHLQEESTTVFVSIVVNPEITSLGVRESLVCPLSDWSYQKTDPLAPGLGNEP